MNQSDAYTNLASQRSFYVFVLVMAGRSVHLTTLFPGQA